MMSKKETQKSIPRILVCYGWCSPNRGDQSITIGIDKLLSKIQENVNFDYEILPASDKHSEYVKEVSFSENYFRNYLRYLERKYNHLFKHFFWAIELFILILFPKFYSKIIEENVSKDLESIYNSDFILYNAGHLFLSAEHITSYYLLRRDVLTLLPAIMARRLNIPYGFWGQSVGPIEGKGTLIDRFILNGAEFVYCRETESMENLQAMGVDSKKIDVVPDPAFILTLNSENADNPLSKYDIGKKEYLCLTVRRSGARRGLIIPEKIIQAYLIELAKFIDLWANETDVKIVIVSQHGSHPGYSNKKLADFYIGKKLKSLSNNPKKVKILSEDMSIDDYKNVYSNSLGLIGMRFHSLIFALQSRVPIIGLSSYFTGPKISGIFKDLGLEDYLFDVEELDYNELYEKSKIFMKNQLKNQTSDRKNKFHTEELEKISKIKMINALEKVWK